MLIQVVVTIVDNCWDVTAAENQLRADGVSCFLTGLATLLISTSPSMASVRVRDEMMIYDGESLRCCAPLPLLAEEVTQCVITPCPIKVCIITV